MDGLERLVVYPRTSRSARIWTSHLHSTIPYLIAQLLLAVRGASAEISLKPKWKAAQMDGVFYIRKDGRLPIGPMLLG